MIYSAMIFALGVFVSGLLWLGLTVALVGRARRLTARRILAGVATRRAEFETERDQLRARHALEMHKVESEVNRVLDMATAYRLESDVKERDVVNFRAELKGREEDLQDMQQRLEGERELLQDLERRHAEAGTTLRAVQHALSLEIKRRAMADEAADAASMIANQQRVELSALRAENETLRAILSERVPAEDLATLGGFDKLDPFAEMATPGGRVVAMPTRTRPAAAAPAELVPTSAMPISLNPAGAATPVDQTEIPIEPQQILGEVHADFGHQAWRAPATLEPRMPVASLVRPDEAGQTPDGQTAGGGSEAPTRDAETRFFQALAEIRALKRAASQAGE